MRKLQTIKNLSVFGSRLFFLSELLYRKRDRRLQLYWPCFVNNQFGNDTRRAFGPTGPDKSLSSLCK